MAESSKTYKALQFRIRELKSKLETTPNLSPIKELEIKEEIQNLEKELEENKPFSISCSKCGKTATMPFEPRKSKPNYCKKCFWEINR